MSLHIDLREIFINGNFGQVQLGQSIDTVQAILGEPIGIYDSFREAPEDLYNTRILTYDAYEFWFIKYFDASGIYKLSAFQNDSYKYSNAFEGAFKEGISLDFWIFRHGITLAEVEQALAAASLHYSKYEKMEVTYLEFANASQIIFEKADDSDMPICAGWMYHPKSTH